jgi:hypothetical protein
VALSNLFHFALATLPVLSSIYLTVTSKPLPIDKLDLFKPVEGRRLVLVPKGEKVKRGTTPGGEGPYKGSGGARETFLMRGWSHIFTIKG